MPCLTVVLAMARLHDGQLAYLCKSPAKELLDRFWFLIGRRWGLRGLTACTCFSLLQAAAIVAVEWCGGEGGLGGTTFQIMVGFGHRVMVLALNSNL